MHQNQLGYFSSVKILSKEKWVKFAQHTDKISVSKAWLLVSVPLNWKLESQVPILVQITLEKV